MKQFNTPNKGGALLNPKFIVVHYTAGASAASSINWLCSKQSKASAHVVIGRDGSLSQLVPFNTVAWHAGESARAGLTGLNKYSIGIELDNLGPLFRGADGKFRGVGAGTVVAPENVYGGQHAHPGCAFKFWHQYTEPQVAALRGLISQLWHDYPSLCEIVGHEDVSPGRKWDPGPGATFMPELKAAYRRALGA
jgi:N-acetylmuramoyl-L-alanine amidase